MVGGKIESFFSHQNSERLKFPKGLPSLTLTPQERNIFEGVVFNKYGPVTLKEKKIGDRRWLLDPEVNIDDGGKLVLEEIQRDPQTPGETNNPFFDFILSQLPEEEQTAIENYFKSGGRTVCIRRTIPSEEYIHLLSLYSETHHVGVASLTLGMLTLATLVADNDSSGTGQETYFNELQELSQRMIPIHFAPIKKIGKKEEDWEDIKKVFERLNAVSDPFEFIYDCFLTINEIEKLQSRFAGASFGLGLVAVGIIPIVKRRLGETLTRTGTQLSGEALALFLNKADRLFHYFPPSIQNFLSRLSLAVAYQQEKLSQIDADTDKKQLWETLSKQQRLIKYASWAISTASFAATVTTAYGLSQLSQENLLPYLAISPLNTSILVAAEVFNRAINVYQLLKNYPQKEKDFVLKFLEEQHRHLKFLLKKNPSLAIALIDFLSNTPAVFADLGTAASFITLAPLITFIPQIYDSESLLAAVESASALLFEGGGGFLGSLFAARKDPWQKFLAVLPFLKTNHQKSSS